MARKPHFTLPGYTQHIMQLGSEPTALRAAYRALFASHIEPGFLDEIRRTVNQELAPGTGQFKQQIEVMLGRQTDEKPRGRPRKESNAGLY